MINGTPRCSEAARGSEAATRERAGERGGGEKGPVRAESTYAHYRSASRSGVPAREKDREKDTFIDNDRRYQKE